MNQENYKKIARIINKTLTGEKKADLINQLADYFNEENQWKHQKPFNRAKFIKDCVTWKKK